MNVAELARWLAGHRPAPSRVVALVDGAETPLRIAGGTHRWSRAAKLISELNAEGVRLFDKSGELIDSCALTQNITDVEPAGVAAAASGGSRTDHDVRIIGVITDAFAKVARDATAAQSETYNVAFKELAKVVDVATQRLVALEQFVHSIIQQRSSELSAREAELVAREAELEEAAGAGGEQMLDSVMSKLADKITSKQSGDVVADTVKDAVADGVKKTNGTHEAGANGARKK